MPPNPVPKSWFRAWAVVLAIPLAAAGQGLPAEWEVRDMALALGKQMELLAPELARFDTANWEGAPAAYAEQREMAMREAGYAGDVAREVAAKPTGLAKAFELHLRVQSVESLVASLSAGARTYQPSAPAEQPQEILSAASVQQIKLRTYVMELAAARELELAAIDAETQRCRAEMLRAPAPPPVRRTKPTPAAKQKPSTK